MFMKLLTSVIFSSCLLSTITPLEAFSVSLGFGVQQPVRPIVVAQPVPVVQEVYYQQPVAVWGSTPVYTGSRAPVYTQVNTPVYGMHAPVYNSAPVYTGPVMSQSVMQPQVVTQTQFVNVDTHRSHRHRKHYRHHRSPINSVDVQFLLGR